MFRINPKIQKSKNFKMDSVNLWLFTPTHQAHPINKKLIFYSIIKKLFLSLLIFRDEPTHQIQTLFNLPINALFFYTKGAGRQHFDYLQPLRSAHECYQ